MLEKFIITDKGYKRLTEELSQLKTVERPSVIQAISEARAHGDLSENAEYHSAKEKQGFIEAKISDFENKFARAEVIIPSKISAEKIVFGATVKLFEHDLEGNYTYQIVSDYEADITKNLISIGSPLGRALLGNKAGDEIEVNTPKGIRYYKILEVSFI